MHQCTQSSQDPRKAHGEAKIIGSYLKGTRNLAIYTRPSNSNIKVKADAEFNGNWFPGEAKDDSDTAHPCSGFFISYLGCLLMWKSHFQTKIYLSSTESE